MGDSRANIIVHPQAAASGEDLEKRLHMPYIKLLTSYIPEKIDENYKKLGEFLGCRLDFRPYKEQASEKIGVFSRKYSGARIAVGEAVCGSPFDIAHFLLSCGVQVPFVFRDMVQPWDREAIEKLNAIAPDLLVYSGVHPSTFQFRRSLPQADMLMGLDSGYFQPEPSASPGPLPRHTTDTAG
jgi:nitrogenase molybdenum-cofactor synthesis protein NifE